VTPGLAAALVLVPFAAALLGLLAGRRLPGGPAVAAVGGTGIAVVLAALVAQPLLADSTRTWESSALLTPTGVIPITLGVRVDATSATVALMVVLVALAVQVYSIGYLRGDPRYSSFAALVSLFTAAMLTVVLSADLIVLYVGWEVMGVCSYFLIGHHWEERASSAAAVKAFLMTRLGDVGFLFGIFVLGAAAGSFRLTRVLAAAPTMASGTVLAGTLLLTLGVVAKAGQFPLHSWLPDAMAGPTPVSALIHAATMVAAGAYVVARLYPAFLAAPASLQVLGILAAISMLGAALAALAAEDLKRVLAYSTISQLGFMFVALAVGARTAAVGHLLSHAAFKALLFLGAGVVIHAVGSNLLGTMGGLRRGLPVTFAALGIGFAALAGLPPTSGFFSKDAIVGAVTDAATGATPTPVSPSVAVVLLICTLLTVPVTAAYATRAWLLVFYGPGQAGRRVQEPGTVLLGPVVVLAAAALLLGFALVSYADLAPALGSALLSLALLLLGALASYLSWRRAPGRDPAVLLGPARQLVGRAFYTDDLYERTVVPVVLRLAARVVGWDSGVLGRGVSGAGRSARRLGGALRLTENGNPQFYVTGVLAGVLAITLGVVVLR
jgi:NADH-quinone oxidoreductase subunit L